MSQDLEFAAVLSRVARAVVRMERAVCCADLTFQQFDTLRLLGARGATGVGVLATALDVDVSTASRNLALLARRGYVTRARGPHDARTVRFALSDKGAGCLTTLCCDERAVFAKLLGRVPVEERARVARALDVLDGALAATDEGRPLGTEP